MGSNFNVKNEAGIVAAALTASMTLAAESEGNECLTELVSGMFMAANREGPAMFDNFSKAVGAELIALTGLQSGYSSRKFKRGMEVLKLYAHTHDAAAKAMTDAQTHVTGSDTADIIRDKLQHVVILTHAMEAYHMTARALLQESRDSLVRISDAMGTMEKANAVTNMEALVNNSTDCDCPNCVKARDAKETAH